VEVGQAAEQQETAVERHAPLRAASLALVVVVVVVGGAGMKEGCAVWACGGGGGMKAGCVVWAASK